MALSNITKSFLLAGAAALAVMLPIDGSRSAQIPRVTGACSPTQVKYALSTRDTSTASTSNILDTAINFTQSKPGCIIIDFAASEELEDPPPGDVVIRPVLKLSDGTTVHNGRPGSAQLHFAASGFDFRTTEFVFPGVTPGTYVLRMELSSSTGGGVRVMGPNVVVHYN